MSNNNGQPKPQYRKKFILNDYRPPLPTTEEPLPGAKYPAQFMWEQKNNGAIVAKVHDGIFKEGSKNTHKEVEMDWGDRGVLFEALLEATTNDKFGMRKITPRKKQFIQGPGGGRMSDSPIAQVNYVVTRGDDGVISLGWSKGDYKAVFIFKGIRDLVIMMKNEDGQVVEDRGAMSRWSVRAYVQFHRPILDEMEANAWEPPKPRNDSGQNNRPQNNNNNNNFDDGEFDDPDF